MYHWAKGELADMEMLSAAINVQKTVAKKAKTDTKKNVNTQKDIETLNTDKKSMTTVFKNKGDVGKLEHKVSQRENEIEYSTKLADLLTIYLGEKCLVEFKKNKLQLYKNVVMYLHVTEISNSHK